MKDKVYHWEGLDRVADTVAAAVAEAGKVVVAGFVRPKVILGHFLQWLTSHVPTPTECIHPFPALLRPFNGVDALDCAMQVNSSCACVSVWFVVACKTRSVSFS